MGIDKNLNRQLTLWLGSFLVVAVVLFFYSNAPVFSILFAGFLTLGITLLRYYLSNKK